MENKDEIKTPHFSLKYLRHIFFSVIAISIIFGIGYYLGLRSFYLNVYGYPKVHIERSVPESQKELDFNLFWTVWDKLNEKYFDKSKLISAKMVYGAIKGMVASVGDPYTVFLPPVENKIVDDDLKGSFDGVGIQIGYQKEWLTVIAPVPGSPADKKGVKAGDIIYSIRDVGKNINIQNTQGLSVQEAPPTIGGAKGSSFILTLVREGVHKPFEIELVRDTLDVPSVVLKYVGTDKNIAHITLSKFAAETQSEWDKVITNLLTSDFSGIILDLRNNPGGYMKGAIDLGADFIDEGKVVVIEETAKDKTEYKIEKLGRLKNRKLVVLINGGAAAASEIISGG